MTTTQRISMDCTDTSLEGGFPWGLEGSSRAQEGGAGGVCPSHPEGRSWRVPHPGTPWPVLQGREQPHRAGLLPFLNKSVSSQCLTGTGEDWESAGTWPCPSTGTQTRRKSPRKTGSAVGNPSPPNTCQLPLAPGCPGTSPVPRCPQGRALQGCAPKPP